MGADNQILLSALHYFLEPEAQRSTLFGCNTLGQQGRDNA